MFVGWDTPILLLWCVGLALIVLLSVITYLLVSRVTGLRWRRPWWAAFGVLVVSFVVLGQIDGAMSISLIRQKLDEQVGFPAEYVHEDSRLTLHADVTAILHNVVLADGITQSVEGRWCLFGRTAGVSGAARWSIDDSGFAQIEADGKVGSLAPDGRLLGYGWARGFLLTTCETEFATLYLPASNR